MENSHKFLIESKLPLIEVQPKDVSKYMLTELQKLPTTSLEEQIKKYENGKQ